MQDHIQPIISALQAQGLTIQAAANKCGMKRQLLSAYLTGRKEPGIRNYTRICEALGLQIEVKNSC
jgi:transcriptional regulator with XRE-family HTH domain